MGYKDIKVDWENWEQEILDHWRIKRVHTQGDVEAIQSMGGMVCTRCSKTKPVGREKAVPEEFYVSTLNKKFYQWCKVGKYRYAIVSDEYGLHFDDEELPFYDTHPSKLTEENFQELASHIREKAKKRHVNSLIFWNTSPIMSKPYFYMLFLSGLPLYYLTTLPVPMDGLFMRR